MRQSCLSSYKNELDFARERESKRDESPSLSLCEVWNNRLQYFIENLTNKLIIARHFYNIFSFHL